MTHPIISPQLRRAWRKFIAESENLDTHITLATNYDGSEYLRERTVISWKPDHRIAHVQKLVSRFDQQLHRELNGRDWLKKSECRLIGLGFVEHADTNIHCHLLVDRTPLRCSNVAFWIACRKVWGRLAPAGNVMIQPVDHRRAKIASYLTKELWKPAMHDAVIFIGPAR